MLDIIPPEAMLREAAKQKARVGFQPAEEERLRFSFASLQIRKRDSRFCRSGVVLRCLVSFGLVLNELEAGVGIEQNLRIFLKSTTQLLPTCHQRRAAS